MCKLEEFLRKHNLLEQYIKNVDFTFRAPPFYHFDALKIVDSFRWGDTKEGYDFWINISQMMPTDAIPVNRIQELQREYQLIPPRYKGGVL